MARSKKETKARAIVTVKEADLKIGDVIRRDDRDIENVVAAIALLDDQMARLKMATDKLKDYVAGEHIDSIIDSLIHRGLIGAEVTPEECTPVIEVVTKFGEKISVELSESLESNFDIKRELDKIPDAYKKVVINLDKKKLEADFDADSLPAEVKALCSKSPAWITKMKKNAVKEKKEE